MNKQLKASLRKALDNNDQSTIKQLMDYHGQVIMAWAIEHDNHDFLPLFRYLSQTQKHETARSLSTDQVWQFLFAAIQKADFSFIKFLVEFDSELFLSKQEIRPVLWAVCENKIEIVRYFIKLGVDVSIRITTSDGIDKTLVDVAIEHQCHAVAHLIITTILTNPKTAFTFITSGKMALEYCLLNLEYAKLILENKNFMQLIEAHGALVTPKFVGNYNVANQRQPSSFALIDRITGESDVAVAEKMLHSKFRKFVSPSGQPVVVKKHDWVKNEINIDESLDEMRALKKAFSAYNNPLAKVFFFQRNTPSGTKEYTRRIVVACNEGTPARLYLANVVSEKALASIILCITKALIDFHSTGKMYGDVELDNLVISMIANGLKVTFIDPKHSRFLHDNEASFIANSPFEIEGESLILDENDLKKHWAPERKYCTTAPKPTVAQDIYSFAYMLQGIVKEHEYGSRLESKFPSITKFIGKALYEKPNNRQKLNLFYQALVDDYDNVDYVLVDYDGSTEVDMFNVSSMEL